MRFIELLRIHVRFGCGASFGCRACAPPQSVHDDVHFECVVVHFPAFLA